MPRSFLMSHFGSMFQVMVWLVVLVGGASGANVVQYPCFSSSTWVHGGCLDVPMGEALHFMQNDCRIGEALHPGPPGYSDDGMEDFQLVSFGCSNPSGLRQKESEAMELGPGIWAYSETQLSENTLPTCSRQLRRLASQHQRSVQVLAGAAVAPRSTSTWAGSWSGVLVTTDFKARSVSLPWPSGLYESGRVCASRHLVAGTPFLVVALYGFPRGPTYPAAVHLNNRMLSFLTTEVILGHSGPRVIMGDFNMGPHDSPVFNQWRQHGWQSAQQHAADFLGWQITATSKGRRERDLIWMSPEALRLMKGISISHPFAEHATLQVDLAIPKCQYKLFSWPLPQKSSWDEVDDSWHPLPPKVDSQASSTQQLHSIMMQLEQSLDGHLPAHPERLLRPLERGRAARLEPSVVEVSAPLAKPSRAGEVRLRSDLIGNEVRRWFKQLRRLQALRQSLEAGNFAPSAADHRIGLWSSILRARGFHGGFSMWWSYRRQLGRECQPKHLPQHLPELPCVTSIFEIFKMNFEQLESWHLRQRGKLLKLKHDRSMQALYQELRDPAKEHPTLFYTDEELVVDSVHNDGTVSFTKTVDSTPSDIWQVGNFVTPVRSLSNGTFDIGEDLLVQPGATATRTSFLHSTQEVQHALLEHWSSRWQTRVAPKEEEWTRIVGLFRRQVPQLQLCCEPLTEKTWRAALRRYSPRAARGLDGISHLDLINMPSAYVGSLLEVLNAVEVGSTTWPAQLLKGVCLAIAKHQGAHEPGSFRPVVVFSTIYRTWGAIRSRQLLTQLAPFLPTEQLGFLPGREPLELWLGLQSEIEEALMDGSELVGISTDLVRAFNHIPRAQSAELSKHIGVPDRVLQPWMSFLQDCTRAFAVDGHISPFIGSSSGVPEGDAMSVFCMVQLDWAYHCYMRQFCPGVSCLSFVDNLVLKATDVGQLLESWAALQTYFSLWDMQVDVKKTYSWGLSHGSREVLRSFDLQVQLCSTELGGGMHFSHRRSIQHLQTRISSLEPKWKRLRASTAPIYQKMKALYTVFWPKALHGTNATFVNSQHFDSLRSAAMRALRLSKAGCNPLLRLSLCDSCLSDPGFFYVSRLLKDFARLCGKDCSFIDRWHHVMEGFNGKASSGPFATIAFAVNVLGWRIEVPYIFDHDGIPFHLTEGDDRALHDSLRDGWLQHVARVVNRRSQMSDLQGLDFSLASISSASHSALDWARLRAIQSGTFLDASCHARYDLGKTSVCTFCSQLDTHVHWLECPGFAPYRPVTWPEDFESWPISLKAHLLPSRNPYIHHIKHLLHTLWECPSEFHSSPSEGVQHLFVDGAFVSHEDPWLGLASWGVLNATSGLPIAAGPVPGLRQGSDVAEIFAVWKALQWAVKWQTQIHLWLDSKFVADCLDWVLRFGSVPSNWANQKLWRLVAELLDHLAEQPPHLHWIPSHLRTDQLRDPFEEWWANWNARVDALATSANRMRTTEFLRLHDSACQHHEEQKSRLSILKDFYIAVASDPPTRPSAPILVEDDDDIDDADFVPITELLSLSWKQTLYSQECPKQVNVKFCDQLLSFLLGLHADGAHVRAVSFLEVVFVLLDAGFQFPFWDAVHGSQLMRVEDRFERPTLTHILSSVRNSIRFCVKTLELGVVLKGLDRSMFGVFFPTEGIATYISTETLSNAQMRLRAFCTNRPLRKVCDLARPV